MRVQQLRRWTASSFSVRVEVKMTGPVDWSGNASERSFRCHRGIKQQIHAEVLALNYRSNNPLPMRLSPSREPFLHPTCHNRRLTFSRPFLI